MVLYIWSSIAANIFILQWILIEVRKRHCRYGIMIDVIIITLITLFFKSQLLLDLHLEQVEFDLGLDILIDNLEVSEVQRW